MSWMNKDKLYLKHGTEKTVPNTGGEYRNVGDLREVEFTIDLTELSTSAATILSDNVFFPKGVRIEEVELVTLTGATSSGSGTLDVGLVKTDRTSVIDADAFLAAVPKASMDADGEKTTFRIGVSGVGSSVGTTTAEAGYVTAKLTTAVYQTGVVKVRIRYMRP